MYLRNLQMPADVTVQDHQGEVKRVICSTLLNNALQPVASVLIDYSARCSYGQLWACRAAMLLPHKQQWEICTACGIRLLCLL